MTEEEKTLDCFGYKSCCVIGKGAFSTCYLVDSKKYNQMFVCKAMKLEYLTHEEIQKNKKQFDDEIHCLLKIIHPNIIKVYDYFTTGTNLFIILQYCSNGTIESYTKEKGAFNNSQMLEFCRQISSALCYLHSIKLAHHDIKPANIFLDRFSHFILADFGLAQILAQGQKSSIFSGSLGYMAPEKFSNEEYDPYKADIWAFGVTLYQLATGKLPFIDTNMKGLIEKIKFCQYEEPSNVPEFVSAILNHTLIVDPILRWSAADILNYLNNYIDFKKPRRDSKRITLMSFKRISISTPLFAQKLPPLTRLKL